MPTFRVRQQENIVLRSFDFQDRIYPLLEIIKEHDRSRKSDVQRSFKDIHLDLITNIKAKRVFVDLPVYLKESGSMKDEVVSFSLGVINNIEKRCQYINYLSSQKHKIIPVISSYLLKTGEENTIQKQEGLIRPKFNSIAFRLYPQTFSVDFPVVQGLVREDDFIIIDLDQIIPYYKSPPLRPIVAVLKGFTSCCKILLRSAINTEIQNVNLEHAQVVFEADNSQIDNEIIEGFGVNVTGDYVGIKKDDLTAGGTISPGFIYYDAVENQYYGFKASIKKDLSEFKNTIVPDVLSSPATQRMLNSSPVYLSENNQGYITLLNINNGLESGKSQAKFKKIAMDHYLYCMREKIRVDQLSHQL